MNSVTSTNSAEKGECYRPTFSAEFYIIHSLQSSTLYIPCRVLHSPGAQHWTCSELSLSSTQHLCKLFLLSKTIHCEEKEKYIHHKTMWRKNKAECSSVSWNRLLLLKSLHELVSWQTRYLPSTPTSASASASRWCKTCYFSTSLKSFLTHSVS